MFWLEKKISENLAKKFDNVNQIALSGVAWSRTGSCLILVMAADLSFFYDAMKDINNFGSRFSF